jgi:hypothetical protein
VNEGYKCLEEGIAARASDIDLVLVSGYAFPAWKGGPMYWAEREVRWLCFLVYLLPAEAFRLM